MIKLVTGLAVAGAVAFFAAPEPAQATDRQDGARNAQVTDFSSHRRSYRHRHSRPYYGYYRAPYYGYYASPYYYRPYGYYGPRYYGHSPGFSFGFRF
jgi:hypothetical protein